MIVDRGKNCALKKFEPVLVQKIPLPEMVASGAQSLSGKAGRLFLIY